MFEKHRYPQKFKFFGSYPYLEDSRNKGQHTWFGSVQVLDLWFKRYVIHRKSDHLLLPTIFIKNEKEQLEKNWKIKVSRSWNTCNCLISFDKQKKSSSSKVKEHTHVHLEARGDEKTFANLSCPLSTICPQEVIHRSGYVAYRWKSFNQRFVQKISIVV